MLSVSLTTKMSCRRCQRSSGPTRMWASRCSVYRLCIGHRRCAGIDVPVLEMCASARAFQQYVAHACLMSVRMYVHMSIHVHSVSSTHMHARTNARARAYTLACRCCRIGIATSSFVARTLYRLGIGHRRRHGHRAGIDMRYSKRLPRRELSDGTERRACLYACLYTCLCTCRCSRIGIATSLSSLSRWRRR